MNDVGGGCYPTQETIAQASGLSVRSVRDHTDLAIEHGWLVRTEHGFRGQKWANYEYQAAWPDPGKGAAAPAGPSNEGAAALSKGAAAPSKKDRQELPPILPEHTSTILPESGGKGFDRLWKAWPDDHLPDNADYARRQFDKMTDVEQAYAEEVVDLYRARCAKRGEHPRMIPYLKERKFLDLVDAPDMDVDGDFIITTKRPEWSEWMGAMRKKHGAKAVEGFASRGNIITKTRWPDGFGRLPKAE